MSVCLVAHDRQNFQSPRLCCPVLHYGAQHYLEERDTILLIHFNQQGVSSMRVADANGCLLRLLPQVAQVSVNKLTLLSLNVPEPEIKLA